MEKFEPIAALDVGLKRIGIALALHPHIVMPQPAVLRKNRQQAARDVKAILEEYRIAKVIVGIPEGHGAYAQMRRRIEHFVGLMELKVPVVFWDESYSSVEAADMLKGVIPHRRDGRIDSVAAKVILERYLAHVL